MSANNKENILITAATITAELSEVRKIAKAMSLGVMNAKAISHRAGDSALGFRPITDFIDEMAKDVMQLVVKISIEAFSLSRLAIKRDHISQTNEKYRTVFKNASEAKYADSLKTVIAKLDAENKDYAKIFIKSIHNLEQLLERIKLTIRGAQVLSTTSRVEASRALGFSSSLEVVADNLEQATEDIRDRVVKSQYRLRDVTKVLIKEARK